MVKGSWGSCQKKQHEQSSELKPRCIQWVQHACCSRRSGCGRCSGYKQWSGQNRGGRQLPVCEGERSEYKREVRALISWCSLHDDHSDRDAERKAHHGGDSRMACLQTDQACRECGLMGGQKREAEVNHALHFWWVCTVECRAARTLSRPAPALSCSLSFAAALAHSLLRSTHSTFSPSSSRRSKVALSVFSSSSMELLSAIWSCSCSWVSSSPPSGADRERFRGGFTRPAVQKPTGSRGEQFSSRVGYGSGGLHRPMG